MEAVARAAPARKAGTIVMAVWLSNAVCVVAGTVPADLRLDAHRNNSMAERLVIPSVSGRTCTGTAMGSEVRSERIAADRAERYRQYAQETLRHAEATDLPEIKATYISLSVCWSRLAELAEHTPEIREGDEDKEPRLGGRGKPAPVCEGPQPGTPSRSC